MAYSAVPTVSTGDLWTASNHNTYIRDNFTALAATRTFVQTIYAAAMIPSSADQDILPDGSDDYLYFYFRIPQNYSSALSVVPVVSSASSGNIYWGHSAAYGANGEAVNAHSDSAALSATAYTSGILQLTGLTLASAAAGDNVKYTFQRDASNVLDTVGDAVTARGFYITWTGTNYG